MIRRKHNSKGPLGFLAALLLAALPALVHGAVDVTPARQPETVCIQCHGGLPDRLGAPVKQWRTSVHAQNGITCNNCHGGDPNDAAMAMNPARGFMGAPKEGKIPEFCGRCHPGVLKDYLASAHGRALGRGGPTCVTCHSNHGVMKANINLINEQTCSRCHPYERARVIKAAMQQTEGYIVGMDRRISELQSVGVDTERMGKTLFAIRNRFHTLFHDVNVERVRGESAQINGELGKLHRELKVIEDERSRRQVVGAVAIAVVLVMALLFHLLRKTYDE